MDNKFDIYSSKVKRINIPIPGFTLFHKASSEEQVDPKFIGRERISDKLYTWLKDDPAGGSYLVTGFRGMGKSSFVGRVLYQLTRETKPKEYIAGLLFFISILIEFFLLVFINDLIWIYLFIILIFISLIVVLYFLLYNKIEYYKNRRKFFKLMKKEYSSIPDKYKSQKKNSKKLKIKKNSIDLKRVYQALHRTYTINRSYSRLCVHVNLGQEVLNEREVLSLISHQLFTRYRKYILSPIANFIHWFRYTIIILSLPFVSNIFIFKIKEFEVWECFKITLILAVVSLGIYLIAQRFSSSQSKILRKLRFLNQRLDAQVSFDESYTSGVGYGSANLGTSFQKKRLYDIAKVREIEQELIDVMDNISRGKGPSIVVVFDELDKVDSNSISVSVGDAQTEFTNEKNFPGGGTTRRRKQNVLHLLANMKLFVSTAKAKFIFISGRELYDAYLADLSDREFAVSSIFSGVIYVDSFCVNEHKGKDVMSNVETYICRQLIPYDYIKRKFARYYIMELKKGSAFDRFDINLKLYYQYLADEYKNMFPNFEKSFVVGEDNKDDDKIEFSDDDEIKAYMYRCYIDKAVNLLYHFSVYLYHVSNGSPKKMMLYFEKYIKTSYDKNMFLNSSNDISNRDTDTAINILSSYKSKYYLSFGYVDQRKIGFLHYISFPINQILVNANQYSDKLLVSVSFLIDHIYKFHNSGFTWRNLEYTPELLEVYKIPGFRSFINSIISYLKQTHLIEVTFGLYQFKFRKQIAEEISLASKFSEEIAALFNFTLDESQNVKQHYYDIRNAYLELEGRGDELTPKHTPRLSIGLHNILGDLYMFDEEFNNAIFEYHAAVKELEAELDKKNGKYPDLRNMLYSIRLLLKLGLANEKRNTNESALVVYNELVSKLLHFRYFDEKELQLTYRLRKLDDWPLYQGVLFPQKYDQSVDVDFNDVHPRIIDESNHILRHGDMSFMASGQHLSTAFNHLLTPNKYSVIQRISLFQDIRLIFQALLAKLFVKEKISLGGITLTDIETIESEFIYLNLATNVNEKFLTSSDFFRRLGDIMFYKNGLSVTVHNSRKDVSFVDGLYFWGYDIKRELLDFCNVNNCYQYYEQLLEYFRTIKDYEIKELVNKELHTLLRGKLFQVVSNKKCLCESIKIRKILSDFLNKKSSHIKFLQNIPTDEVLACNKHRQDMFNYNMPVPCFACNYYNRSLRILMKGMFGCDILEERKGKSCSVFIILEKLLIKGTSRSLRQDYVIHLAEILDCRADVLLSCATEENDNISSNFMDGFYTFLQNIGEIKKTNLENGETKKEYSSNNIINEISVFEKKLMIKRISKLEECILYYWEASNCFYIGNDLMKASASLKKILRIFQNYLKVADCINDEDFKNKRFKMVYDNIENIKEAFVRPCLIYLYSHYNNINYAEIQKLKWVFSVQAYESIPLNRLSLFPDVEQILLLYYDLLRRCVMALHLEQNLSGKQKYQKQLSKIYRSTTLGFLRQDSTIYERVMALRFKTLMNMDLLHIIGLEKEIYYSPEQHEKKFVHFFIIKYINSEKNLSELLGNFKECFRFALQSKDNSDKDVVVEKINFLEFLVKDSLFCITRILEIITPHTASTLFSNSFYGEIYQMLYEWNMFFDELLMFYKYLEKTPKNHSNTDNNTYKYLIEKGIEVILDEKQEKTFREKTKNFMLRESMPSEKFFNETLHEIGKAQVNYTLAKYSLAMAKESFERALQMHHEGKAYKDIISQMYYLDDDLKNDTIQFGMAVERYKINNKYIHKQLDNIKNIIEKAPMYDIDKFVVENMNKMSLNNRFFLEPITDS